MNYLFFLNAQAGELEKILSGTKSMVVKEFDPAYAGREVRTGDCLYFLRNIGDCDLRVKATVIRVLTFTNQKDEDISHLLKEMQARLQLTEQQYNDWSRKGQVSLVEFYFAQKIEVIRLDPNKIMSLSGWIAFDKFSQIAAAEIEP